MKYLTHYMEAKQTELMGRTKAFFAFGEDQMREAKKNLSIGDDVVLVSMPSGMIVPKENAEELHKGLEQIYLDSIKEDKAENGKDGIILRELENYESFYTGCIREAVNALDNYGYTEDEIRKVFNEKRGNYEY